MQVTYQLTAEDYRHALIAFRNRNLFSRWVLLLSALLLVFVAAIQLMSKEAWLRSAFPGTIAGIGLLLFAQWCVPYLNARRQFRNTPSARGEITLEVEDAGLHFRSPSTDASVLWNNYIKWIEDERIFALFASPLIFVIIPKRAFDAAQMMLFKETLAQKIPAR